MAAAMETRGFMGGMLVMRRHSSPAQDEYASVRYAPAPPPLSVAPILNPSIQRLTCQSCARHHAWNVSQSVQQATSRCWRISTNFVRRSSLASAPSVIPRSDQSLRAARLRHRSLSRCA
jgi:hypothetical protein